jgi:hypothetical protein
VYLDSRKRGGFSLAREKYSALRRGLCHVEARLPQNSNQESGPMKKNFSPSRRSFLLKSAAALGAVAAFPTIVPSTVLGATAPSNRINLGMIGMGLMMGGHLEGMLNRDDVQVLAVCDVYESRRNAAKDRVEKKYAEKTPAVRTRDARPISNTKNL